jgi:L-cysteine:1D-myo-inositol 2-amino-2-deoxy-alpha-D-glucopyranoside ligase
MDSWSRPPVPDLPGPGLAPRIRDDRSGQLVASAGPGSGSTEESVGRLYVCGITPYDAAHLGHVATYLAFDVLQRAWLDAGLTVRYVQNVTDVDDPLLERATQTGRDWRELASTELGSYRRDMQRLRVLPPDQLVGVVESMDLSIDLVERLVAAGATYAVDDDLYFPVRSAPGFGEIHGLTPADLLAMFTERGGDPDREGKRDPLDALIWRAERPGEPAWESPFGRGRPGWHVECSAIALAGLGPDFDVQGGGSDLVFPHHEMSKAQAEVVLAAEHQTPVFARCYSHQAMVRLDGVKMSKSLGNMVFVDQLHQRGEEAPAIRLSVLAHHYDDEWDFTDEGMVAGARRLAAWRAAADSRLDAVELAAVRAALADDLDTPAALAVLDARARQGGSAPGTGATLADVADALLGVDVTTQD